MDFEAICQALNAVKEENIHLKEALRVAAEDLAKAANQFDGMRASQRIGYNIPVESNPEKFTSKSERAYAALRAVEGDFRRGYE